MDTEGIAVNALKRIIYSNPLLKSYEINENDKTPSWDGDIFVFHKLGEKKSYNKSNIDGKVPIQIKGKEVKKLQGDFIKYPLQKDDLSNYYKDGGVIFFVVQFIDPLNTKVYYASLLPFDLQELLKKMGEQQNINYNLTLLPTEYKYLTALCRMFLINSRIQSQNVMDKPVSFKNKKTARYRFVIPSDMDPRDAFLNYEIYMYQQGELKTGETTDSIDIPVQKGKITSLLEGTDVTIGVNNEVVYSDVFRKIEKDKKTLRFGQSFQLDINDLEEDSEAQKVNINFKENGTFEERLKDCQFMLSILKQKEMEINGHAIELHHNHPKLIEELPEHIHSLKDTINVFEKLNASFNVSIEDLSEEDHQRIEILKRIFLYDNYSDLQVKNDGFIKIDIANKTFLLFAYRDTNQKLIILNACDWKTLGDHIEFLVQEEGSERKGTVSPYVCNKADDLLEMENFDLEDLKSSYLTIDYNSDIAITKTNLHLLEFLTYYDQQINKNENILFMLEDVFKYVYSVEKNEDLLFINLMQIIKRMREFTPDEKEKIIKRKNETKDKFIMCGYLLLMGSKMEFDIHFDKLTQKEQALLKDYPIYNLINKI